jgi:glutaredoxin
MELKIFTLPTCPKCPEAKRIAQEVGAKFGIKCIEIDLSTSEGELEGLMYQIMSTPSIALDDEVLGRGRLLSQEELETEIKKRLAK